MSFVEEFSLSIYEPTLAFRLVSFEFTQEQIGLVFGLPCLISIFATAIYGSLFKYINKIVSISVGGIGIGVCIAISGPNSYIYPIISYSIQPIFLVMLFVPIFPLAVEIAQKKYGE